jgi:ATP-binding cassette subfamily B protein
MRGAATRPGGTAGAADGEELLGKALDRKLLRRILSYAWKYKLLMGAALVVLPVVSAFELAQPYLLKKAIDEHIAVGRLDGLNVLALVYLVALAGQYTLLFAQTYLMQLCGQRAMSDLRMQLYRHVMGLSQSFFERTQVGRLMTRLTSDIEALNEMFASGLVSLVADLVKLSMILVTIFVIDWRLALVSLASAPVLALVAALFRRLVREAFREIRTRLARLNAFLQEHLSGVKVVQAFAQEELAARRFAELNRGYRTASARAISADAALYAIVEAIGTFALAGLLWHGGARIYGGTLTFGILVAFVEYLQKLFAPIRDLSTKYTVMQQAMAAGERVFGLLDTRDSDMPASTPSTVRAPSVRAPSTVHAPGPAVVFDNVSFSYRPDQPVLRDVSLALEEGEALAIVGTSGAGKSTLVKLLAGFYQPTAGRVLLGGEDVTGLGREALRRRVVLVGQEPFIFSGSLEEAVGLGEVTTDKIREALRRAGAERLVGRITDGLAARIDQRGANLSAGERQLVALARALCRDPEVLVLDEATANVDPETERAIETGTAELMRGRTSLVIAHRLSTIARASRIVVIDGGRVAEIGTRTELLARDGIFARLSRLQTEFAPPAPSTAGDPGAADLATRAG